MGILDRLKELIASEESPAIHFAAGETARVEIARSGEFTDMSGQKVALTPKHLSDLAQTFDAEANLKAQDRMKQIASRPDLVVPGHDPAVFAKFPKPGNGVAKVE